MNKDISQFLLLVSGQIDNALFPNNNDVCVRLTFSHGNDWKQLSEPMDMISASCFKGTNEEQTIGLAFQATFSSTSAFKWPQLVLTCYSRDTRGADVVLGYGAVHIPSTPGKHALRIPCFAPEPSSIMQSIVAWLRGKRPEFIDASLVTKNEGRQVTRVSTQGIVKVDLSVAIKDAGKVGLQVIPSRDTYSGTDSHTLKKVKANPTGPRTLPNLTEDHPVEDN